jgi:hypothetical protein
MGGTRSMHRVDNKSHTSRVMKSDGSRTLGRKRRKCEDNVKWILNVADYLGILKVGSIAGS